jgi:hypothetical protein
MEADEIEESLRADSITKTCRSLVGKLVPKYDRVNKKWQNVSPQKREAVLGKTKVLSNI